MLRREAASSFPGAGGPGRTLRGSPRAPVPGAPGWAGRDRRASRSRGCRERSELPAGRARKRRAFRFLKIRLGKTKKKTKKGKKYLTVSLCAYPSQGLKCAGRSAAGRAAPDLSRDWGKRRGGSGRAQSPPREPGRAAAGDLTPAQSRPVTSFFSFSFGFGLFFFLGAITLLPLKIAL